MVSLGLVLGTVIFMEAFAWWMHKYILHGPLWFLHKSHHEVTPGWFEINDLVALLYAILSFGLIWYGVNYGSFTLWLGVGIAVYGVLYFIFHDIIIHRRVKIKYKFRHPYINRLIRAHKIHHKHLGKNPSEAYGFLYALRKYRVK